MLSKLHFFSVLLFYYVRLSHIFIIYCVTVLQSIKQTWFVLTQ